MTAEYFLDSVIDPHEADRLALDVDLLGKGLYATEISDNPNSRFGKAVRARLRLDDYLGNRIGEKFSRPLREAGLDKRATLDQAVTMLFAGVDTTSVAMTYAAELLTGRVDGGGSISRPAIIAAVRSALLKFPPVYFIPRGVLADVKLSNIQVKKGWFVNIMICALHEHSTEGHKSSGYIPFGLGEKRCPGEVFAMRSSAAMLERLFTDYKVELSGGREGLEFMPGLRPKASKVISLLPTRH